MKMFDNKSAWQIVAACSVSEWEWECAITQCYHHHQAPAPAAAAHLGRCLCVWTPILLQLVADPSRGSMGPASNQDNTQ